MNPLNDDELDGLLNEAKRVAPQPSPEFPARVLRAYDDQSRPASGWSWLWWRPVRIPAGLGVLGAVALVAFGAVVGRTLLAPPVKAETRVVYEECAHNSESQPPPSGAAGGFTFHELKPVREMRPRVVRSIDDDR